MNLEQVLDQLKADSEFNQQVTSWVIIPESDGRYMPFPEDMDRRIVSYLKHKNIAELYSHQAEAYRLIKEEKNIVVVTPTASGKTYTYNLPVVDSLLKDPTMKALYLFPTKALANDQRHELEVMASKIGSKRLLVYTYDGDTPVSIRKSIRDTGNIVLTNPDMLHSSILPNHTKWARLFENLKYVVIDELHTYRGIFGSQLANVLRRLKRIANFYGAKPLFVMTSATIANPKQLAERLIEADVELISDNGAPQGEKNIVFYNPPLVNASLGVRKSSIIEASRLGQRFIKNSLQTIVFTRSRVSAEVLLTYLRSGLKDPSLVRSYRGGYLPNERRETEAKLRNGEILGVVSTNALELGIDIGSLQVAILTGYPGSISSTYQQLGRAGRRMETSLGIVVTSAAPLDQYMARHPEYFFSQAPEQALINPNNLYVLLDHLKCASFELPFTRNERFGTILVDELLNYLAEQGILHLTDDKYFWSTEGFPAADISLRSLSQDNFVIIDTTSQRHRVIGEVDRFSAPMLIHEEAIYLHGGQQYQVEKLDYEEKKAYVTAVDVDYYTDADLAVKVRVLDVDQKKDNCCLGEVAVMAKVPLYKKIKLYTHENVGWGKVSLPEEQMHTSAYWFVLPEMTELSKVEMESLLLGLANVLAGVAPLYVLSDAKDFHVVPEVRSDFTSLPTIYFYDSLPGGIGLAEKLFRLHNEMLDLAYEVIKGCPCESGCPSCVGVGDQVGMMAKSLVTTYLERR